MTTHLLVETPDTHPAERDYRHGVILGEFLGLPWRRVRSPDAAVRLRLSDAQGEIRLPDHFFGHLERRGERAWLTAATLPAPPLPTWDTRALAADILAGDLLKRRAPRPEVREVLIHTGQHYDANMSAVLFEELDIPHPGYTLGIGGGCNPANRPPRRPPSHRRPPWCNIRPHAQPA